MYRIIKLLTTPTLAVMLVIAADPIQAQDTLPFNVNCIGFDYPMTDPVAVPVNKMRMALPLRATLKDADNRILTDSDLVASPVVQVMYDSGVDPDLKDVTGDLEWQDEDISEDNYFVYMPESQEWHLSISARPYSAAGTYFITMESADIGEYTFPDGFKCEAEFIRLP